MAAANNLDISAASDVTSSSGVTSPPCNVKWRHWCDAFVAKTTTPQQDSCYCPSTCSTEHCSFIGDDRVESNISSLSSNGLTLDNSGSSLGHDAALTVTEPYCGTSTSADDITHCTGCVCCSEFPSLLTDSIPHLASSVAAMEKDLFPTTNGILN